jgi:GDP-L-fucose synthase
MVGSALERHLQAQGWQNLVLRTSKELDLTRQEAVERFFAEQRPEYVFLAAARVGGILANKTCRAEFIRTNLEIQGNVIHSAWQSSVRKLLFFSSSCVYPRLCPQPMKEEYLWSGPLEPTNEPYAVAKLAGMSMCRAYREQYGADFISVVPSNLYGPNDNFDPAQSHLVAALIRKFHEAKINRSPCVSLWGTGMPRREALHVDDLAKAAVRLMEVYSEAEPINIGWGQDFTVREIATAVQKAAGYEGELHFDPEKPDGAPRKLLEVSKMRSVGCAPSIDLQKGLETACAWHLNNHQ